MRILYGVSKGRPYKIAKGRMPGDDWPVQEGDIPAWFKWSDGSTYWVFETQTKGRYMRALEGALFGLAPGEFGYEFFGAEQ